MIVIESFWRGAQWKLESYQRKPEGYQWKLESYQWKHLRVSRFGAHTASAPVSARPSL